MSDTERTVTLSVTVKVPRSSGAVDAADQARGKLRRVFAYAGLEDGLRCAIDYTKQPSVVDSNE